MIGVEFIGDAGTGFRLQQDNVDYLAATANVQLAGRATNNFYEVHLIRRDAAQLAVSLVALAGYATPVDQYLVATAAQSPTVRASGAAGATAATRSATACHTDSRNSVQHVIDRVGLKFRKIGSGVGHRRAVFRISFLPRGLADCQSQPLAGKQADQFDRLRDSDVRGTPGVEHAVILIVIATGSLSRPVCRLIHVGSCTGLLNL